MDIPQIKALLAVVQFGSLTRAADKLGLTQPALSRQIRLLETELGELLFLRHGRGMVTTAAGARVAERAACAMRELDAMAGDVAELTERPVGTVLLGMTPTAAESLIVPLTRELSQLYPAIRMKYLTAFTGHLLDWLHAGELDVAVLYDAARQQSVSSEPLLREQLVVVTDARRRLSSAGKMPIERLADERLILPSASHGIRVMIENEARKKAIALNVAIEVDSLPVIKALVLAGQGTTILPLSAVQAEANSGALSIAPLLPDLQRQLVLARSSDRQLSRAGQAVCRVLVSVVAEEVRAGQLAAEVLISARTFSGRI